MHVQTLKQFSLQTVFLYATERCNLKCTYCYFKHKQGRDIDPDSAGAFLARLRQIDWEPRRFEISGGEPLLRWNTVKALVARIEQYFPGQGVGVQTNGLLLTPAKIAFLKQHRIALEVGLDGNDIVTTRWRTGLGRGGFQRIVSNIHRCLREGVAVGCNMTVHPKEAGDMVRNCEWLYALGVRSIDVTPAAFMRWGETASEVFKAQYIELMQRVQIRSKIYRQEDVRIVPQPFLDLSFHPSGYVLCGDAYLCLSDTEKRKFSLWDEVSGDWRPEVVRFFLRAYSVARKKLQRRAYTHRDYVCASFQIVNDLVGKRYVNTTEIIPLMRFLTRMHFSYV